MMDDVYSIIEFKRSLPEEVALLGYIDDQTIRSTFDKNIRRLNNIADAHLGGTEHTTNPILLKGIIQKINNDVRNSTHSEWSGSELRTLAYNLSEFHNDMATYYYATSLFDNNWSDRLFRGVNNYLMSHWNTIPKEMLHDATSLLQRHLKKYSGDSKRLLEQKKNVDFFLEGGPVRLAQLAKARKVSLQDAPRLIGYSPNSLTLDYFSDTILSFYQGREILGKTEEIKALLMEPSHTRRTRMLMTVRLVKMADNESESIQNIVSKVASSLLGDEITKQSTWDPFIGATEEEKNRIDRARIRVNQWMAKKIINVFFEKCVQDYERKDFWLRYVPYITQFKIVGSSLVRAILNMDERVRGQLNGVFRQTNQNKKETSALILWIKDRIFVEFSDVGALYVYKSDNMYIRRVLGKQIERIEALKMPKIFIDKEYYSGDTHIQPLGQLVEIEYSSYSYYRSYSFNPEGKFDHRGNWSSRLSLYMEQEMDINIHSSTNYRLLYD